MILLRNIHVEQSPSGISIPVDSDLSGAITNATSPSSVIGGGIGYFLRKQSAQAKANSVEALAEKRLIEAKSQEQQIILEAKEKALKVLDEVKIEERERRNDVDKMRQRVEQRENMFDKKISEFETRKEVLESKIHQVEEVKLKISDVHEQAKKKLERVAQYTKDEAKEELITRVEQDSKEDLLHLKLKMDKRTREEVEEKAKDVVLGAMQRTACNHAESMAGNTSAFNQLLIRIIGQCRSNILAISTDRYQPSK